MKRTNWKQIAIMAVILLGAGFLLARFFVSRSSPVPAAIGENDGRLSPCPDSPNCVSTEHGDGSIRMEPIPFSGSESAARDRLVEIIEDLPRSTIITNRPGYLHAEVRSALWGFVDDVELVLDEENQQIDFRSASRLGYSDFGVNRQRMTEIKRAFEGGR